MKSDQLFPCFFFSTLVVSVAMENCYKCRCVICIKGILAHVFPKVESFTLSVFLTKEAKYCIFCIIVYCFGINEINMQKEKTVLAIPLLLFSFSTFSFHIPFPCSSQLSDHTVVDIVLTSMWVQRGSKPRLR